MASLPTFLLLGRVAGYATPIFVSNLPLSSSFGLQGRSFHFYERYAGQGALEAVTDTLVRWSSFSGSEF